MSKILKNILFCGCLIGTSLAAMATAQDRAPAPGAVPSKAMGRRLTLEQAGQVIDRVSFLPEFKKALRPDNAGEIRKILIANGLPVDVPVQYPPLQTTVPGGSYGCFTSPIKVYYPNPPYSWPNNWRIAIAIICWNDAGGQNASWD